MGIMVSEVYEAFIAAGAPEAKAKAAAEAIPVTEQLATKQDIAALRQDIGRVESELRQDIGRVESELKQDITRGEARVAALEAKMWRAGLAIAGAAVLFNRFLDWIINK